jgi:hypothetical protein
MKVVDQGGITPTADHLHRRTDRRTIPAWAPLHRRQSGRNVSRAAPFISPPFMTLKEGNGGKEGMS